MPFFPNFSLYSKNYPRNINYRPAVIFFICLDFEKNCYSRTASYVSVRGARGSGAGADFKAGLSIVKPQGTRLSPHKSLEMLEIFANYYLLRCGHYDRT